MLFNSYSFILIFLPVTITGFYLLLRKVSTAAGQTWLCLCSLCFYSWWNPAYLPLLLLSIGSNYTVSVLMHRHARHARVLVTAGITFNLLLIGYYKYAGFFVENLGHVGWQVTISTIALPLAISFFTFQQIAYLVDVYRGRVEPPRLEQYALFVSFFPQLIAGPIVLAGDIVPQFQKLTRRVPWDQIAAGMTLFAIGLFKKVLIADPLGMAVDPVYAGALAGTPLHQVDALAAPLFYGLQLYFDFSGYSDMALGLGHLFGLKLPRNFDSPYRALSISDFWRRWHITLSNFLRDYLYIPLGGSRASTARTIRSLVITMFLGGLWHGAAWTFILWGLAHGAMLTAAALWKQHARPLPGPLAWAVTIIAVMLAWVLFRAESLAAAGRIYAAIAGGVDADVLTTDIDWLRAAITSVIALALPDAVRWVRNETERFPAWRPGIATVVATYLFLVMGMLHMNRISIFLYFNF